MLRYLVSREGVIAPHRTYEASQLPLRLRARGSTSASESTCSTRGGSSSTRRVIKVPSSITHALDGRSIFDERAVDVFGVHVDGPATPTRVAQVARGAA